MPLLEEHQKVDLKQALVALQRGGYQFHITSQRWLVKYRGNPVCERELYHDDGGMSSRDHVVQAQENMREAIEHAWEHVAMMVKMKEIKSNA